MKPALQADSRGVVYLEFLFAFVPLFTLFLCLVQLALLQGARQIVDHSAYRGVRAACVILDDPESEQGDTERGCLRTPCDHAEGTPSARLQAVIRAVQVPLATLVPSPRRVAASLLGEASVADNLATGPQAALTALAGYLDRTTAVTFPEAPGSSRLRLQRVPAHAELTLRVTHLYACGIPVAASLLCGRLRWDARERRVRSDDGRIEGKLSDMAQASEAAQLRPALTVARFAVLQAEARLPNQAAWYPYRTRSAAP